MTQHVTSAASLGSKSAWYEHTSAVCTPFCHGLTVLSSRHFSWFAAAEWHVTAHSLLPAVIHIPTLVPSQWSAVGKLGMLRILSFDIELHMHCSWSITPTTPLRHPLGQT